MRFLDDRVPAHDLTYDDVFMVPRHSSVSSRYDVDLATSDGTGATIPIVVANMTAIAGRRMAETVARRGGLVVIPQDIPIPVVADVVAWVKQRHHVFDTPIELRPDQTVAEALSLIPKRAHKAAVVVQDGRPVGVVSEADCADVDRFAQVSTVMSGSVVTVAEDADPREVYDAIERAKAPLAVAVSDSGELVGVLTRLGALRATLYTPAVDANGGLRIDYATRLVTVDGTSIHLTPTEYRLLLNLAENTNRVLTHDYLLSHVWGVEYSEDVHILRATIWRLRQKIEKDPTNPIYILNEPGIGYRLAQHEETTASG